MPLGYHIWEAEPIFHYAFDSVILDEDRIGEVLLSFAEVNGIQLDSGFFRAGLYLGPGIARLNERDELSAVNGQTGEYLIDSAGDLLLVQGAVRQGPTFLLKRIGTTLGETLSRRLFSGGVDALLDTRTQLALREARLPVELRVEFADGTVVEERWDGQYRWQRFRYPGHAKVRRATVDPEGKIALDVNPANNSWVDEKGVARRAATKWSARFLLWLQTLLETHLVLG